VVPAAPEKFIVKKGVRTAQPNLVCHGDNTRVMAGIAVKKTEGSFALKREKIGKRGVSFRNGEVFYYGECLENEASGSSPTHKGKKKGGREWNDSDLERNVCRSRSTTVLGSATVFYRQGNLDVVENCRLEKTPIF